MAHELDFSTGSPALAYVGEVPWHGLGQQLPAGQSIDVWRKSAKLEWKVEMLPVQYQYTGKTRTVDGQYVLARDDTGEGLSIVSEKYHVVQPAEVLDFFRKLVSEYGYELETAGALAGGRKIWALARTGRVGSVGVKKDNIAAYVLLATSFDKTLATTASFTSIRVVCQNTLGFAQQDVRAKRRPQVKVPHSVRFDAAQVHTSLGLLDPAWEAFVERCNRMSTIPMTPDAAEAFVRRLFNLESAAVPGQNQKTTSSSAEREVLRVNPLFRSAPGNELPSAKGTLWGLLNAVTYYVDHVRSAGNGERLESAWFGNGGHLKDKAWNLAMQLVAPN